MKLPVDAPLMGRSADACRQPKRHHPRLPSKSTEQQVQRQFLAILPRG